MISSDGRQRAVEGVFRSTGEWAVTDGPETVTVRFTDVEGETRTETGSGLFARCVCHELDHLDGKLYTDGALMLDESEIEKLEDGEFDPAEKVRQAEEGK